MGAIAFTLSQCDRTSSSPKTRSHFNNDRIFHPTNIDRTTPSQKVIALSKSDRPTPSQNMIALKMRSPYPIQKPDRINNRSPSFQNAIALLPKNPHREADLFEIALLLFPHDRLFTSTNTIALSTSSKTH